MAYHSDHQSPASKDSSRAGSEDRLLCGGGERRREEHAERGGERISIRQRRFISRPYR